MTDDLDPVDPVEDEDHEAPYDRHEATFADGAPDVGISWINVHRQTLTEIPPDDEQTQGEELPTDEDGNDIHWHVYGWPSGGFSEDETTSFIIFGDLTVSHGQWFLGVTIAMGLSFRDRRLPIDSSDPDQVNHLVRTLGAWASTPLYDVASLVSRQLVGSNFLCDLNLPQLTPKPHFAEVVAVTEDDDVVEAVMDERDLEA